MANPPLDRSVGIVVVGEILEARDVGIAMAVEALGINGPMEDKTLVTLTVVVNEAVREKKIPLRVDLKGNKEETTIVVAAPAVMVVVPLVVEETVLSILGNTIGSTVGEIIGVETLNPITSCRPPVDTNMA